MSKRIAIAGLIGVAGIAVAVAWSQQPLAFDVAAVKPAAPGGRGGFIRMMPGNQRYLGNNISLRAMMTVAYSVTDRQISGGPLWVGTDTFDVDAKSPQSVSTDDLHVMLQHLLEERFQLKVRHEKRELPVWSLVLDKAGSKMPVHDPLDKDYPPMGGTGRGKFSGKNVTMNYFSFFLSRILDRNVIDRTGLPARYDVALEYLPEPPLGGVAGAAEPGEGPTIFTALREQLGLKLEAAKGPVEFLVIEHVEKPSEN